MLCLRAIVATLAFGASVFGAVLDRRDASTILADIADINTKTTDLDNKVVAFPETGGTLLAALAIHTASTTVDTAVKKGTTDTLATPSLTSAEGQSILAAFQVLEPVIIKTLEDVIAKKAAFASLPVGGIPAIVKSDISTLYTDTKAFEDAILAITPDEYKEAAKALIAAINAEFDKAVAAYA